MKAPLCIVLLLSLFFSEARGQKLIYRENFQSYSDGSDGSPVWHPIKGSWHIRNRVYEQHSTEYDCASMLDMYMDHSFRLEAEFEHLDGDIGVGFIFASKEYDDISFSQMIRYDGGTTFLMGYFQSAEFNAIASVKAAVITPNMKHTLTLEVNRDANSFKVFIDGKAITLKPVPLTYAGGYIGLQSSAGKVRFHNVTLTELTTDGIHRSIDWIERCVILPDGKILIPDPRRSVIRVISPSGEEIRAIGKPAKEKGQLTHPNSVAMLDSATMVITDRGTNRVHLFSRSGTWLQSTGWTGSSRGQFNNPRAVAVNEKRRIFVVDKGNNRIQVLDSTLSPITDFGSAKLKAPADIAIERNRIFVLNAGLCQIEAYEWTGEKAIWKSSIPYGGGEARGLAVRDGILYLSVVNQVRAYDINGSLLHTISGRGFNFIFPQGITLQHDTLSIADYFGGRIVRTSLIRLDDSSEMIYNDSLVFGGKKTYHYTIRPDIIGTIPPRMQPSREHSFTTATEPKTKLYTRIKMATLLFTHILDDSAGMARHGEPPAIPAEEIERIRQQINDGIRFYWIHSGMNFFIDMDFIIVNDRLRRNEIFGTEWWYPPKEDILEKYLNLNGRDKSLYGGFLYLSCTQAYDTARNTYALSGKGGGFTTGAGTGKGYGISWWDVTKKNHNAGNNWLMVHEFNHQLDDIFMLSGYPEYWFNHISPTIGTAADFGEHFDANAYILRMVPVAEWSDLQYTDVALARDGDSDGIPDNDSSLPLDEVRLESDSTSSDSDQDGIHDIDELKLSNWITEGWGETFGGKAVFPNLTEKDTDHDGVPDSADSYPCYPQLTGIQFTSGKPSAKDGFIGTLDDTGIRATLRAGWDSASLSFSFEMNQRVPVKLMLDAEADGWFLGRGNYLINLKPVSDTGYAATVQIFNAMLPNAWPFMDKSISDTLNIFTSMHVRNKQTVLTVTIPKNEFLNLHLVEGEQIGISAGFYCPVDDTGAQRFITIFEPNRFFDVKLIK